MTGVTPYDSVTVTMYREDIDLVECPAYSVSTECVSLFGGAAPSQVIGVKEERMRLIKPIVLHCRWQVDT